MSNLQARLVALPLAMIAVNGFSGFSGRTSVAFVKAFAFLAVAVFFLVECRKSFNDE